MCLNTPDQYDAYKSGDFNNWKTLFDQKAAVQTRLAKGEITQAEADAAIAGLQSPDNVANKLKSDASANMEMREYSRQNDIGLGKIGIDKNFAKFDQGYYDKYKADYSGYYNPQVDEQYAKSVDKMTATLADRGMLESSVGAAKFADVAKTNADARTNIANEGLDASNKLRGQVQNAKQSLYGLNEASADPQAVNAQAVGQATALVAPPTYSPLGSIFSNVFDGFSQVYSNRNQQPTRSYSSPYGASSGGYGSGSVVR